MTATVDVLAARAAEILRAPLSDRENLAIRIARMEQRDAAVAELIEACEARNAAGRRPSWSDIAVDCSGQLEEQALAYDAAQARYFSALANCKGTTA